MQVDQVPKIKALDKSLSLSLRSQVYVPSLADCISELTQNCKFEFGSFLLIDSDMFVF